MAKFIFRLMQENGAQGPQETVELENHVPRPVIINRMAREWALVQTGHPWYVLTVEDQNGNIREVQR